jgi:hypothetical protein
MIAMELTLPVAMPWRQRLMARLETPLIQRSLIALIVANAVILGMETSPSPMQYWGPWLGAVDQAILAVFIVEIALCLAAHRFAFFRDPWSVFDFKNNSLATRRRSRGFPRVCAAGLAGNVRLAIAERAAPSSHAAHSSSVPRCFP